MSYLRYLCLFVHSDVQCILCCVFVLFSFVSLDCPFLITPSVLSNIYTFRSIRGLHNQLAEVILIQIQMSTHNSDC